MPLRKSLGNKDLIQTILRRGYRFNFEVREVSGNGATGDETVSATVSPEKSRRWIFMSLLAACVLVLTSFSVWLTKWPFVPAADRTIRSLAVLPLKNLNASDTDDTFELGIADLLISRLGSLDRFSVRPIEMVASFAGADNDPLAFGAKLRADAVFTGTFRTENGRVFVTARLLDVRDGAQLWSGQFDENETDIFDLQETLAKQIALSISASLSEKEQQRLAKRNTENADAYRAYVRGRAIFDQKLPDKAERASVEFQRAISFDPTYSLAYSGLADALSRQGNDVTGRLAIEFYGKARSYARRAVELDPESSEAFVAMGRIRRLADWDWQGAGMDFQKAIELNPNNADAHLFYGQMLGFLGRFDEGLAEIEQAININPISVAATGARLAVLEGKGDIDEALRLLDGYPDFARENPNAIRAQGTFRLHKGDYAGVIEMGEGVLAKNGGSKFAWYSLLAAAYLRTNQTERFGEMLDRIEVLSRTDTKALYSLAMNYSELGRSDDAFAALEKCFEMREERMVWINVEPRFAMLRTDPRFHELVKRIGLE